MGVLKIFQIFLFSSFLVLNFGGGVRGARGSLSQEEDLELEKQLKLLNKPARKTIKDVDGTIYDCVDIDKQPALDHPLLKNHKIQMQQPPSSHQEKDDDQPTPPFVEHVEIGIEGGECPEGTVIIRRTRKEDLLWSKNQTNVAYKPGYHYAIATAKDGRAYHGAGGALNVYRPYVKPNQYSEGMIMIKYLSPESPDFNGIRVGWTVTPSLFGDDQTRLFSHWTADPHGATGCYNMLCLGFVQISRSSTFGMLCKASEYKKVQRFIYLKVAKNVQTGDWWLYFSNGVTIGYWPKALFTGLADHATTIHWGGQVYGPPDDSPPMGSGHFSSGGMFYASMIAIMQVVDDSDATVDVNDNVVTAYTSSPRCYDIDYRGYRGKGLRHFMYFGGPGGNNCEG